MRAGDSRGDSMEGGQRGGSPHAMGDVPLDDQRHDSAGVQVKLDAQKVRWS